MVKRISHRELQKGYFPVSPSLIARHTFGSISEEAIINIRNCTDSIDKGVEWRQGALLLLGTLMLSRSCFWNCSEVLAIAIGLMFGKTREQQHGICFVLVALGVDIKEMEGR